MAASPKSSEAPETGHQAAQNGLTTRQRIIAATLLACTFGTLATVVLGAKAGLVTAGSVFLALVVARNL